MIETDQAYKDAISARERSINVYMPIGFGIDNTAADDISAHPYDGLPMSSSAQLTDANYVMTSGLATFEADGIPTAVSAGMRTGPIEAAVLPIEAGVWSDDISDAEGNLQWSIQLSFSAVHSSALTLYTPDVHILEAEVVYSKAGTETLRQTYQSTSSDFRITDTAEYDSITVNIHKVDQPYKHLRIVEFEFGSSVTLSRSAVTGEVTFIAERDRTGLDMPLNELDFSIINDGWVYDFDSDDEQARAVEVGKPLELSYSIETSDGRKTIQAGRFIIRDIDLKDTTADVTCYDPRVLFTDVNAAWSIPTTTSIGDALDALCEDLGISHLCDDSLYTTYPPRDLSFDEESTYMDDLVDIFQLMGLEMVPGADGILRLGPISTPTDYGAVTTANMYSYPQRKTDSNPYNYIRAHYGEGSDSVDLDLRTDTTVAISQLSVRNPLVMTQAEAQTILNRLASSLSLSELQVEWTGDPALEVGDLVGFPGRWSTAVSRYLTYQELTFDGGLRAESRCLM